MRLSHEEITLLKEKLYQLSSEAKLYLFGSRADRSKRGGDIDLLIIDKKLTKRDIRKLKVAFKERFGEQKIDIVLDDGSMRDPFVRLIAKEAIRL